MKEVQVWDERCQDMLQDCFGITDWEIFFDCCGDMDDLTETITEYMKFCEDNVTIRKLVRVYPNDKFEASADMRKCIMERRTAFINGVNDIVKAKRRELRAIIRKNKFKYKEKIEKQLRECQSGLEGTQCDDGQGGE